ncbi:MAG: hypothetical protein ACRYGK_15700 [Janthinobacterium lividum]
MIARRQIRLAVLKSLSRAKFAGCSIQSPGDWNTPSEALPAILVRSVDDRKESFNKGQPEFNTIVTVEMDLRVGATDAESAQDALEALCYKVEMAVLTDYDLIRIVSQVVSVDTKSEVSSDGKYHFGGARMAFNFELPEIFEPVIEEPLLSFGLHFDAGSPFDSTGVYPNPHFPGLPAPRTSGPDGRDEGALDIQLPQ